MLSAHPFWFAGGGLLVSQLTQPLVTACDHGDVATGALDHQHVFHRVAAAQSHGFVNDGFQGQVFATAHLLVSGDDGHSACVFDAVTQRLGREAAEHHRVGCADTGTGLHRGHAFDRHGDVDHHAVAFFHAD